LADVNSNININFNTAAALAQLRQLQAGLSRFHQSLAEGNLAAANAQKGLNAQLLQSIGATGKFSASQVKVAGSTLAFTSALEKNKLSLREYYRYTMAAATANTRVMGRAFAQEREIINRARRDRVKALQAQYIQMNKANSGFMDAIRIMPKSLAMANGKFTELGTRIQYAAQRQQFLNQLLKQGSTQLLNFGKNTQWAGRQLMVGLTMPLALFGSMAAKTFRELETEIVKFRRVYGDAFTNDAETDVAVENIRKLASEYTKYGVAVTKTVEMAATAAAAGFVGNALTTQVETATKLAVLGQIEQQQALETTISLQSAFGISSEQLAKKIDFLNAVENQTLLSIEDLTIAIPKAAPVIKQLGGSVEDLAFFMTAMKEGGINASEGANALKSGLASLINPSEKAAKFLAEFGINVRGIVEGNQGDIKATVIGFAQALDTLDPLNRARAIEQMFGKFQFSRLSTLFQNVTKDGTQASRALSLAGSSVEELAILSEREMKKIEDSVGVKFQAAVEQFKQTIMPIGKVFLEALTPVVKFFGNLFEKFNGLSDQTKKVIAIIVGVVAGLGPVVLMTFGLLANGVANVIKLFALLRGGIARLNGQTNVMGAGFNYMTQEQIENAASSQQLHQTHTRLIEVFNVEKTSVNALAASYNSLSTQMRAMASQNPALFSGGVGGATRAVKKLPPVRKYRDGILSVPGPKGAGDIQPAMLAPGEAVIPAKTTEKYKGLISAIFKDQVPGFMAGRMPKVVAKAKSPIIPHPERQSGATFVGMPVSAAKASQSREMLDKISDGVKSGRFATMPPSDFGTLLQPFSGRSFPARGVGGVYRKPNGQVVVVKPTIDEKTALAEVRATQIAREVHGLVSPKQTIRTMLDPTDPARQRKFIVIESPYDPRIAEMSGKFSKSDMVKQLVASTLRGDKDLQKPNLSGNVLADVGTAGVFDRASGFRDFAKAMPSMEQQAVVNLLGVKGGAKKFFAQETSATAASMTPREYDSAIKKEISASIPKLEKLIKSWDLDPSEKIVYGNMLARLKSGAKTDWSQLQPLHARAGEGIAKFITGVDPDAPSSIVKEQLNKYALASSLEDQSRRDDLRRSVETEFRKRLETVNPERAEVIKAAWEGGKAPVPPSMKEKRFAPRQTTFLNEISKMVPINVDGVTKYIHPDDMDAFKSDPDGRAKYARTKAQVVDNLLYRMGVAPDASGRFVAGGKFSGSRFASVSALGKSLRSTGKESGGGLSNVSKTVKPFAKQEIEDYNKRVGDPLKTKTGRAMLAAGYSPDEVRSLLRENLSHIKQEVTGSTSGAKKMKTGQALYDARILNNYMNAKSRSLNILDDLNKNNILGLSEIEKSEYRKAAEFMAKGEHPKNPQERALLAKAVELDQRVINAQANGTLKNVAARFLPADLRTPRILQTLFSDSAFQPGRLLNLAATTPSQVLVKPGEFLFDKNAKTLTELTTKNTGPKPPGTQSSTGSRQDRRTSIEGPGQTTVTKSQADRIAASGGVRVIRGRDAGDPYARLSPVERIRFDRFKEKRPELNESQLKDILRRKLKHEQDIAKAKEKEAAAAKKAAKRAEMLPKQQEAEQRKQTQASRQRYLEEQRRAELNRQQALNYDAAVREDQKRTLKDQKAAKKAEIKNNRMARQQRIGGASGGMAMGLGMAGSALMMTGNTGAGMGLMGASAVAGMAPMLMNPYVAAATAVVAVGAGMWMLERQANKTAKAQSQLVDATSATTAKMKAIGEMNDKVGASEIYAEKRSRGTADRYTTGYERGKQQYGVTFLESEVGKDVMSGFTKSMASGTDTAAQQMALQLAGYISDGVMSAEQAHSVASQIGMNLNNQTLTTQISGQLLSLVGPGGKDLLNNPIEIRVNLVQEKNNVTSVLQTELQNSLSDTSFSIDTIASETSKYLTPGLNLIRSGSLIPGVDMGFVEYSAMEMFGETKAEAQASAVAAGGVQSLEFSQAQIDSLNVQFDKEKKILEAKKAATKDVAKRKQIEDQISALEDKRLIGVDTLRQGNADVLEKQMDSFRIAQKRGAVENAFFDSLKEQVRLKAEETGQGDFVEAFLKSSADLESKELEVKIDTIVGAGMMPVQTATTLLSMFAGEEESLETFIDVTTRMQDPGLVTQLVNSLGGLEGETGREILLKIGEAEPGEAELILSTIARIQKAAGKEINFEVFMQSEGAMDIIASLQKDLEAIEKIKGPITREVIATVTHDANGDPISMQALLDRWHEWEGLDDEVKKTVIQEYITLLRIISPEQVSAYAQQTTAGMGSFGREAQEFYKNNPDFLRDEAAAALASQAGKALQAQKDAGLLGDTASGTKADNPLAFLDSLAMRIKQVKDNAFNALKPVESLLAAFRDSKTQKGAFALFDGIQNRLLRLGAGEELRGAISSMSAEDFSKVAALKGDKALFTFAKGKTRSKDTITGLTPTGKAVDQGYKEEALGNFNLSNEETIKGIQDQTTAYNMLIGSGVTAGQALDVVSNRAYAAAIASGAIKKGDPDWKKFITNIKTSNTDLERQAVLNKLIRDNEDFKIYKEMPKLASQMKELGYSTEQIDKVIGDPELAKVLIEDLKDGKLDSADIAENLNSIEARKIIDIQVQLNKGNLAEAAELGRQIVDELFAAQEGLIRTGEEANKIIVNDRKISDLEAQIDPFIRQIEGITEEVNDLNRVLEMNPIFGNRAIQAIEDENNALSNDLTIISNAAEEVNKKYDEQAEALSKIQNINEGILEQQQGQLDLADALTSGDISAAARAAQAMRAASAARFASAQSDALQRARENEIAGLTARPGGRTREQIEKKQYENSQRIYAMETDPARIAILKDIQDKQDDIYNIEENKIEPRQKEIDDLVAINKEYQRSIDKQIENLKVFGDTKDAWDKVNAEIDYYAATQLAINNPEALAGVIESAGRLEGAWKNIIARMEEYKNSVPSAVKDSQGLIKQGEVETGVDLARIAKEREDKEERDRKTQLALRKLTVGAVLTDEEKTLLGMSTKATASSGGGGGKFAPQYKASGGLIDSAKFASGAFAKGTDTVPAMLTPGEYVLRKSAVEKYGVDNLDAMNVGYYRFGGLVKSLMKKVPGAGLSGGIYQFMEEIEKTLSLKYGSNRSSSKVAKWSTAIGRAAFNMAQHGLAGLPIGGYGGLLGLGTGLADGVAGLIREGSDYGLKGGKYANKAGSKATQRGFDPKKELDSMSVGQSAKNVGKAAGLGALFGVGGNAVGLGFKKFFPNILQNPLVTKVSSLFPKVSSFALPKMIANIKAKAGIEPSPWEKAYAIAGQQADAGGFTPLESLLGASHSTLLREVKALVPHSGTFVAPKSGIEYAFSFKPASPVGFPEESTLLSSIRSYADAPSWYSEKLGPQHIIKVTTLDGKPAADLTWDSVTGSIAGAYTLTAYQNQGIMKWLNEYAGSMTRLKHSTARTADGIGYSTAVGGIMPDKPFIDKPLPINLAILEAIKTSGLDSILETRIRQVTATTTSPPARPSSQSLTATRWADEMATQAAARERAAKTLEDSISAWRADPNRTYNSYPYFKDGGAYIDPQDLNDLARLQPHPNTAGVREPSYNLIWPEGDRGKVFIDDGDLASQLRAARRDPGYGNLYRAKGGIIPEKFVSGGYSSGTDTVPAMLTPGEYVLRKDAVKKYGVKNLDAMNVGYYDDGGEVSRFARRPKYGTRPSADNKGLGRFFGKGDRDPSKTGANNDSWLARYARSKTESDKRTQALMDKSPLTSWMGADALGLTGFLKTITGQATTADKFNGVFFPLNFLGIGKLGKEGAKLASPVAKETKGFLSKFGPMFSKSIAGPISRVSSSMFGSIKAAGSKVIKPIKELFLPAANPNFNIKNSFINGLQTGKARMGFVKDTNAIKKAESIMKPLKEKLNAAGYEQTRDGGTWMLKGTHSIPYDPRNAIEEGHPLWDTLLAISKQEVELMKFAQRPGKNAGYYASLAGSLIKKTKDKVDKTFPGLKNLVDKATELKLPGQIDRDSLQIGAMLKSGASDGVGTGVNTTYRATLDGVAGFYKTGLDFAEVQREIFGSLFARAANLIAPKNIPVAGFKKEVNGIFSPDVAAQGAETLKALKTQAGYPDGSFNRLADPATATSSGYRSAIMAAMRFVDDHDGNLTLNPQTLQPGLIDFGRSLDYMPIVPNVDSFVSEMLRPFYTYGSANSAWKDPGLTSAFFSGMNKGVDFLKTLSEKDIVEMLKAAGYVGEDLKKKTDLVLESIKTTGPAVAKAASDMKIRQQTQGIMPTIGGRSWSADPNAAIPGVAGATDWLKGLGQKPPANLVPGASNWVAGSSDWASGLGENALTSLAPKAPTNPLKTAALSTFTGAAGLAGLLLVDPDLSSVKITRQPPKIKRGGGGGGSNMLMLSKGGLVPNYFAAGGFAKGTDTVPAMLTPGEFVMSKYAVDTYGVENMKSINSGSSVGDSVYNYNLNLNVKSDANPDEIARAVMVQIKSIDAQRIRGTRI
jgi:TP901 family phage tail tape measure protein